MPTDATRYKKIQTRYNVGLKTEIKDFLPVIGGSVPNRRLTWYDVDDTAKITGSGTGAMSYDYIRSYHGKSCLQMALGGNQTYTVSYSPESADNLMSLSETNNGYAHNIQTGKHGNEEDKLYFVFLIRTYVPSGSINVTLKFWAGTQTATLKTALKPSNDSTYNGKWIRMQVGMNDTFFDYADGFTADSWEAVTKIDITATKSGVAAGNYCYLQGAWVSLPKVDPELSGIVAPTVSDAYWPLVNESAAIFVSQLFGSDANAGTSRAIPVKTLDKALTVVTATRKNVVIMDSEVYRPYTNDTNVYTPGLSHTLAQDVNFYTDFLETPEVSAGNGVLNDDRIGSRLYYRTAFYENIGGAGTKRTVGAAGTGATYTTITDALAAASASDCIEIIDDGTYNESVTIDKHITIQALPGKKPTWQYATGAHPFIKCATYNVNLFGVVVNCAPSGASFTTEPAILCKNTISIKDCTFLGAMGNASASTYPTAQANMGNIAHIENGGTGSLTFENNLIYCPTQAINIIKCSEWGIASAITCQNNKVICEATSLLSGTGDDINLVALAGSQSTRVNIMNNDFVCHSNIRAVYALAVVSDFTGNGALTYNIMYNRIDGGDFFANDIENGYTLKGSSWCNRLNSVMYAHHIATIDFSASLVLKFNGNVIEAEAGLVNVLGLNSAYMVKVATVTSASRSIEIENNIIKDVPEASYGGQAAVFISDMTTASDVSVSNNIFYNNHSGIVIPDGDSYVIDNNIFDTNTEAINSAVNITVNNSLYNNSADGAGGGVITHSGKIEDDPLFNDPDNLDFGYPFTSPIETSYPLWVPTIDFVAMNLTGNDLTFNFLSFTGAPNVIAFASVAGTYDFVRKCSVSEFFVAGNMTDGEVNFLNCLLTDNSIGIRVGRAILNSTCDIKNNILLRNRVGVLLHSPAVVEYNTILQGDYGLVSLLSGVGLRDEYISTYLTLANNILFENLINDYYGDNKLNSCLYGSSNNDTVEGEGNIVSHPKLTDNYFPCTKTQGYKIVSPAYLADSAGTGNIGAKNLIHIVSELEYDSYTFTANPNDYKEGLRNVNLESSIDVVGVYESTVDATVKEYTFAWKEAGANSKILNTQKLVMEYMAQSDWIIGISTDDGTTWSYRKLDRPAVIEFSQIGYYYSDLPWGDVALKLLQIPGFDIDDYVVDTITGA